MQKLHTFLLEKILVLTRPATRGGELRYQVYRQPIPVDQLILEDIGESQGKMGSFQKAFSQNNTSKWQLGILQSCCLKAVLCYCTLEELLRLLILSYTVSMLLIDLHYC